jgi:predicted metalloprotease with PDZ domain
MNPALRSLLGCMLLVAFMAIARAAVPAPRDTPYPGVISLDVDVTDVQRRIIRVSEVLAVKPGRLTLLYPQWLPGNHAPRGPVDQLAGLVFEAGGQRLAWQRDPLDVYAFHVEVPAGVSRLQLQFQLATPQGSEGGRVVFTPALMNLQWNQAVLYPAGHSVGNILVAARLRLPPGWKQASALPVEATGDVVQFAPVTLERLVDSPVFAGRYSGALDLAPGDAVAVRANLFAEAQADIVPTAPQLALLRTLVRETYAALGKPHFERYDFLLALSEQLGSIGLEHHRSTEITVPPGYFRNWDESVGRREVLGHEFVHAWNGKRRRPADLWVPNYNVPMQDSLLWVYEGMTQYYGFVLTARAGLETPEYAREKFANTAALYTAKRPGRSWRPLLDTTNQPVVSARRPQAWVSWQRAEDYYTEGALLWLGVDARLRQLTGGARGLDAFANAFFAAPADKGPVSTYRYADVVRTLNAVAPYDWQGFLDARVTQPDAPLDGPALAGLTLVFDDKPNLVIKEGERERKNTDLGYGLGIVVSKDALLTEVVWDSPAFQAGLTVNTTLVAVNGRSYSSELLKEAVSRARSDNGPIELLVKNQDLYRTLAIDYRGGLRYPHLVPVAGATDHLAEIIRARTSAPAP